MPDSPPPNRKGRPRGSGAFPWRAFFHESTTPVFVLGKGRRLRFANAAWEKLTGTKLADVLGMVCSTRRHSSPLAAALAPTPEAQSGKPDKARRPAPTSRTAPPWWDVTFAPLALPDGSFGIVGFIAVVSETVLPAARKVPPSVGSLRERHATHFTFDLFAGTERFLGQLRHAATSEVPAWFVGEPGSGKETAARVVHHAGPRRNLAFVGLDCAGLQPYLVESLLFGHGGLIGTGHAGTVFLKEPAVLPRDLQQHLAEFFTENKPGTPRLLWASVRSASEDVAAGKLMPEFLDSLAVLELRVPPLRERLADLPRLVAHFLPEAKVDPAVFEVLAAQQWPGNLRELAEVLGESAAVAEAGPVKVEHLPREVRVRAGIEGDTPQPKSLPLDAILEAVEKRLIALALRKAGPHQPKAAELLGILRTRLTRRIEALGLNPGE